MRSWLLFWAALSACGPGQDYDLGSDAQLAVRGGTFVRGAPPEPSGGPLVEAAFLGQTRFPVAYQDKTFSGVLSEAATAATISLQGDLGYWIVPAGAPLVEAPGLPSFDAALSFAETAQAGPHLLAVAAVDADGRFGALKEVPFTLTSLPLPDGPLLFSLYWDRPSDLDLHVVLPDGTEVYKDELNSWEPSSADADDPQAFLQGGRLDLDSNAQCQIDGRNSENVLWQVEPPPGRYAVRVDTFSLCGEATARWTAEARYHGERVALSSGQSGPIDTRGSHGRGAGVIAFELQVE